MESFDKRGQANFSNPNESPEVLVVGGGIIGLSTAFMLKNQGINVTVIDPNPTLGTSHYAAGMLAPVMESNPQETDLIDFNIKSREMWDDFHQEITKITGQSIDFREIGTVSVAFNLDDKRYLHEVASFQKKFHLKSEILSTTALRTLEPMLNPSISGGIYAPNDHVVNPRLTLQALKSCLDLDSLIEDSVTELTVESGKLATVITRNGLRFTPSYVVLATGIRGNNILGMPDELRIDVRPVKGQILRLKALSNDSLPRVIVRGIVNGRFIYIVPRSNGEIVVGATMEEKGFDDTVTAIAVKEMLEDALSVIPGIDEASILEFQSGFRPATNDNAPVVGKSEIDNIIYAFGHFRHGILEAPLTASIVTSIVTEKSIPEEAKVADPNRFRK